MFFKSPADAISTFEVSFSTCTPKNLTRNFYQLSSRSRASLFLLSNFVCLVFSNLVRARFVTYFLILGATLVNKLFFVINTKLQTRGKYLGAIVLECTMGLSLEKQNKYFSNEFEFCKLFAQLNKIKLK